MHIKNIKSNVVLIGGGYWGTNIAKNLVRLKRNIILFDTNIENAKTLKKRFPNKIVVHKSYKELLKNEKLKFFILPDCLINLLDFSSSPTGTSLRAILGNEKVI